jgi:hypothetical protein
MTAIEIPEKALDQRNPGALGNMNKNAVVLVERPPFLLQGGEFGRAKTLETKPANLMPQIISE